MKSRNYRLSAFYIISFFHSFSALQPFLDTDVDYAASPVDLQNLVVIESEFVQKLLSVRRCEVLVDSVGR
jgi:hypothetical protein